MDVTRQSSLSDAVRVAPQIAVDVAYTRNDAGSNPQSFRSSSYFGAVLTGTVPLMLDLPRARPYIAPSVFVVGDLGLDGNRGFGAGLTAGVVFFVRG